MNPTLNLLHIGKYGSIEKKFCCFAEFMSKLILILFPVMLKI